MAELIIQELNQRRKAIRTHKFNGLPISIGRGFDNDVILADDYVSPQHVRIDQNESGWIVHNQASTNGVFIQNRSKEVTDVAPLHSGDVLILGKTHLRVVSPMHQVPETKKMQTNPGKTTLRHTPLLAWILTLVCILLLAFDIYIYMGDESISNDLFKATIVILVFMVLVFIWSAGWAFIGRVLKNSTQFHFHLLMAAACIILIDVAMYMNSFIGYNTCTPVIRNYIETILPIICIGVLFAFSIQAATRVSRARIYLISATVVGVFVAVALLYQINSRNKFNASPDFDALLFAPWAQMHEGQTIEQIMKTNEVLFKKLDS